MTIYIAQNGQRSGPYSLAAAQNLVATGAVQPTDWAWYEGITTWIPLHQVPGFASAAAASNAPIPPAERPVLVWVISIFYFVCTPFALLSLALIPLLASASFPIPEAQKAYFQSQTFLDYSIIAVSVIGNLTGAILLFRLRRWAFYFFAGTFVLGVLMLVYNIAAKNWLAVVGVPGLVGVVFGWCISVAIIVYIWHLFKKGVLR